MTIQTAGRFVVLFAFWLILSGKLDAEYLTFGAVAAALVTFVTKDLFGAAQSQRVKKTAGGASFATKGWRLFCYFAWLLCSIVAANFQVAYLVLHPRLPIQPGLLRFGTRLRSRVGQVMLANSITLTPGTITVELTDGNYLIHALVPEAALSLLEAKMQSKLETIFGEPEETRPEIRWLGEDL
jgi:multicomponent Na+:H+ antiporter subunit E